MSQHETFEELSDSIDVLDTCRTIFEVAYYNYLNDARGSKLVMVADRVEIVCLSPPGTPYNIKLIRPHLEPLPDPNVAYGLLRYNPNPNYNAQTQRSDYLVALHSDHSQFFIQEPENGRPVPYGQSASRELIDSLYQASLAGIVDLRNCGFN